MVGPRSEVEALVGEVFVDLRNSCLAPEVLSHVGLTLTAGFMFATLDV